MSKGWIKLHRSMFDNDLWTAEPFTKGQAWIDLIGNANHKPASIWIRGIEQPVKRGQLAWSELTMAKRWKWSRGKVRRYLSSLETRQMIVQQTNKLTTLLTICKYDIYQSGDTTDDTTDGTTNRTTDGTTDGQQTVHKQECKNNKNEKKTTSAAALDYSSWPEMPDDQILKDWMACRKKQKASHSQTAINALGRELHKAVAMGYTVNQCAEEAIMKTWRGFKAEWMKSGTPQPQDHRPSHRKDMPKPDRPPRRD